jgi:hypothetical protein
MAATTAVPDAAYAGDKSRAFGASVALTLTDGTKLEGRVAQRAGRGRDDPMGTQELKAKFEACAGNALSVARAAALWELLLMLDELADVRELSRALAAEAPIARATGA